MQHITQMTRTSKINAKQTIRRSPLTCASEARGMADGDASLAAKS